MNLWHDVEPQRISCEDFLAVIEIKKGTKNKYELDKKTGRLILDRVLYTAMRYPANYGFIPLSLAKDGDPLDVLVLASEEIDSMVEVRCYPIGAIRMKDNGLDDDKIIAVPFADPTFNCYKNIEELPPHIVDEFMHFFRVYKQLESSKTSDIEKLSLVDAKRIINESLEAYKEKYKK